MKKVLVLLCIFLINFHFALANSVAIKKIINTHFDPLVDAKLSKNKRYQSIMVGVVTPTETYIVPFGKINIEASSLPPSETTIYEIGSITKGLVGIALAKASLSGQLLLDQPYNINSKIKLPNFSSQDITWRNLAQHTSGLPRIPDNLISSNPNQPYVDYDYKKLEDFFKTFKLEVKPGEKSEYSNLGAGLVGLGLEYIYGKSLEQILKDVFIIPLKMNDTVITLNDEQQSRMPPVFKNGDKAEVWQWTNVFEAAGAIKSSMHDMIILLKAMMGIESIIELQPVFKHAVDMSFDKKPNTQLGLFWHKLKEENIIWHNGGTYGSSSFMGYNPDRSVGIVVLSNSALGNENGDDPRLDYAAIDVVTEIVKLLK